MSTQKKLTAMQEFIDRLKNDFKFVVSNNITEMYLQKEKQQIINAFEEGALDTMHSQQYYKETYKKD